MNMDSISHLGIVHKLHHACGRPEVGAVQVFMTNNEEGCMKKDDMAEEGRAAKLPQNNMTYIVISALHLYHLHVNDSLLW